MIRDRQLPLERLTGYPRYIAKLQLDLAPHVQTIRLRENLTEGTERGPDVLLLSVEQVIPNAPLNNDYDNSNSKAKRMAKMSCLKSASRILGPMDIEPNKKIRATVSVAKYFEKYINDDLDDEPSDGSRAKAKDEDRNYRHKDIDFGL